MARAKIGKSTYVAKQPKKQRRQDEQTLTQVFFSGFFWPIKTLWRGLVWLCHRPPLKQIGHILHWFFTLPPLRFIGRMLGLGYLRSSFRELRHVTWPTFRESMRLTSAVIIFSIIFGLIIAVVDFGLDKLFKQILLK
ncbi:MAG: preprotein translocase subunit SecE [Candidatus Saccharimonadales bacterium]